MKTSFKTQVSQMGLGSFVNINIFVMKYYFFPLFFESLKTSVKTPKRKLGSFVQRNTFTGIEELPQTLSF